MKNPAKPGDFGTNGTRGVVGSGMSETKKNAALIACAIACWLGVLVCVTVGPIRAGDESGAWFSAAFWCVLTALVILAYVAVQAERRR